MSTCEKWWTSALLINSHFHFKNSSCKLFQKQWWWWLGDIWERYVEMSRVNCVAYDDDDDREYQEVIKFLTFQWWA